MDKNKINTVDLFAGCGGLTAGFQNAGFNIVSGYEYWDPAVNCYSLNFSHPIHKIDLTDIKNAVEVIRTDKPDLIIGGPPCQDFSHAGKRVEAERADLTKSFAEIIKTLKPKYFVMENVERILKSQTIINVRSLFKTCGYGLTEIVLNASRCGVPQKRKRFFCIGSILEDDDFLLLKILSNLREKDTTLRDYFNDSLDFKYYYRHPRNYNRRAIYSIDEPAATIRGVNRPVPLGYPGHPNDACKLDSSIRALTTTERALIQTFPNEYKWAGTKTNIEQMIGNAVPVKLAEFVAKILHHHIIESNI
jgi:DNA (cytosine-5)-methyltransferase 1